MLAHQSCCNVALTDSFAHSKRDVVLIHILREALKSIAFYCNASDSSIIY